MSCFHIHPHSQSLNLPEIFIWKEKCVLNYCRLFLSFHNSANCSFLWFFSFMYAFMIIAWKYWTTKSKPLLRSVRRRHLVWLWLSSCFQVLALSRARAVSAAFLQPCWPWAPCTLCTKWKEQNGLHYKPSHGNGSTLKKKGKVDKRSYWGSWKRLYLSIYFLIWLEGLERNSYSVSFFFEYLFLFSYLAIQNYLVYFLLFSRNPFFF